MPITDSRGRALLLAALLVLSVVAGGAYAASVDNETTSTSTTSALTDSSTVTDIDNDSASIRIQIDTTNATGSQDADDFKLYLYNNETGRLAYTNSSNLTSTNVSQGFWNKSHAKGETFQELERAAGENVTVDYRLVFNESTSEEEWVNITIYAQNDNDSVVLVPDTGGTVEVKGEADAGVLAQALGSLSTGFGILGNDSTGAAKAVEDTTVDQSTTDTAWVFVDDSDAVDAFDAATADADSGSLLWTASVEVDGQRVPVFAESASVDSVDWINSSQTYAVLNADGSVKVYNVNDTADENNVTISTIANDKAGYGATFAMVRDYGGSVIDAALAAFNARDWNSDPLEHADVGDS